MPTRVSVPTLNIAKTIFPSYDNDSLRVSWVKSFEPRTELRLIMVTRLRRKNSRPGLRKTLRGFRIISLAVNVPVPVAVSRLCQLGATVVKIEPAVGDPLETKHCPEWYKDLVKGQR